MLGLESLTKEEMCKVFNAIDTNGNGVLSLDEVEVLMRDKLCADCSPTEADLRVKRFMCRFDANKDGVVSREEFTDCITELATILDKRVFIIGACMGAVGLGTGIISPLLPVLVTQLGLTVQQYGYATSAKGAAQLVANFPAAAAVARLGRVSVMTGGLAMMGAGLVALTAATGAVTMALARGLSGAAASSFGTASTAYLVDISTPLNRARAMATAFLPMSIGLMLGPAIGGHLSSIVGVQGALLAGAAVFGAIAIVCWLIVPETVDQHPYHPKAPSRPADTSIAAWRDLIRVPGVADVVLFNAAGNALEASAQMTLLPLFLIRNLGLSPATAGSVFAGMAAVRVVGSPYIAMLSDKFSPQALLGPGGIMKGLSLVLLPLLVQDLTTLVLVMLLWSIGNTATGPGPRNFISLAAMPAMRVQALALSGTAGDLGFLLGGILGGAVAMRTSVPTAMAAVGIVMLAVSVLFILRAATGFGACPPEDASTSLKSAVV
mmetsp:Transcript_2188/g.6490  ORF Transcript_2188/g.6490 Transcript_2188/m.6490 type:complete len:493 (-) Transcript_2188:365-1843(-)